MRRTEARLTHEVLHDDLTGFANRRLLVDHLTQALARSKRAGTSVAVLFLDLDRFKTVNDTLATLPAELLEEADNAMYRAKGGDRARDRRTEVDFIWR